MKINWIFLLLTHIAGILYGQNSNSEELIIYFSKSDPSLHSRMNNGSDSSFCSVQFPANYDVNKEYPIICYLKGGYGGTGKDANSLTEKFGEQAILINLPLFKNNIEPLKPDSSNITKRWIINNSDQEALYRNQTMMLDSILVLIPNYSKKNAFLCGFSNGAHSIAILINNEKGGIFKYFDNFIFIGGGHSLQNYSSLQDKHVLFMQGEYEGDWLKDKYKSTNKNGAKAKYFEMKNKGHCFPSEYYYVVNKWIEKTLK